MNRNSIITVILIILVGLAIVFAFNANKNTDSHDNVMNEVRHEMDEVGDNLESTKEDLVNDLNHNEHKD